MDAVAAAVAVALARAPGAVYVGFSGGLDSTVLLHAVAAQRRRQVVAVHVDHALHPDSAAWCRHCESVARDCGVDFHARRVRVAPDGGLEAAARAARYRVFGELLEPDARLYLAHHRDDQAETVLMRLLQGRGLYGMPEDRRLGAGRLERPLLALPRRALRTYALRERLRWIDDPANLDLSMDRNYLRARVLPALRRRFPAVDEALLGALAELRETEALAARGLAPADARCLPLAALGERRTAPLRLRLWLQRAGLALPPRDARDEFLRQVFSAAADRSPRLRLEHGRALRRYRDAIYLMAPPPPLAAAYPLPVPGRLKLPHGELRVRAAAAGFTPALPVSVRFRQGGERLRCRGRERTVKRLLQEAGVPPWERGAFPLLYDARGLLALPGIAERDPEPVRDGSGASTGPVFRAEWRPG